MNPRDPVGQVAELVAQLAGSGRGRRGRRRWREVGQTEEPAAVDDPEEEDAEEEEREEETAEYEEFAGEDDEEADDEEAEEEDDAEDDAVTVELEPDVAAAFRDSEEVNEALRAVLEITAAVGRLPRRLRRSRA